jgi:hypothetical protein
MEIYLVGSYRAMQIKTLGFEICQKLTYPGATREIFRRRLIEKITILKQSHTEPENGSYLMDITPASWLRELIKYLT